MTRLVTAGLLGALALSLRLSLPGMRGVVHAIDHIKPVWIAAAVTLELASNICFAIVFRLFFDRLAERDARVLAWSSQAWGTLVPTGGVSGYAIGGRLARLSGAPTGWIIRRSSGLFFLTGAVTGAALIGAGLRLMPGVQRTDPAHQSR